MNESTVLKSALSPAEIRARYEAIQAEGGMRARNAAARIGVSEGELLAAHIGSDVIRLTNDPEGILKDLEALGEVLALTRNDACVHERKGVYHNASFFSHGAVRSGILNNPDIDLRLFMGHWKHAFAEQTPTEKGTRKSLQFFDPAGTAIHKIYLTNHSNEAAYDDLVAKYRDAEQNPGLEVEKAAAKAADRPDAEINWERFRSSWENLKDVHDFFIMLRKYKVGRVQALSGIGNDFAFELENSASRRVLELARDRDCEIMVFVGNQGCIQIHTGPIKKLVEMGEWYNVLDPEFNLHLNEQAIARSFVVRKPTVDGIVTSVEVFDADNELIVSFFGKRKPGVPENPAWREIVDALPLKEMTNVA